MLTQMRKGAASWPAKVLLGVIALSFVVWGMGGIFTDRNVNVVGEVGGVDITVQQLQNAYNRQAQQFQSQGFQIEQGSDLSRAVARMAADQLVVETLYDVTAAELGVTVGDDTVRGDIASNGLFQDDQGRFDPGRFSMLLQQNGLTEGAYVASLRQQIADSQLQNGVGALPPAPGAMVEALFAYRNERRIAEFAVIPNEALAPTEEPANEELQAYFEDHADRYRAPEYRTVDYILLYPDDLAESMTATEEELHQYYDANAGRWTEPERRHVVRLAYATADEARAAADRIAGGERMEAVAEATGSDVLDMGMVTRDDLFGDLAEPIFALDQGAPSDPIPSPLGGFLVVQVTEVVPESVTDFAAARDVVARQVALEKAYDAMYDAANDLDDLLASGDTVSEAAETLGVPTGTLTLVDAAGNPKDAMSLQIVPGAPEFLLETFAAEIDYPSPVVETSDGGLLAVEVTEVEAERPLSFEEARDRVAADWRAERMAELAAEAAREATSGLAEDSALAAAFEGIAVEVTTSAPFLRGEAPDVEGVGPEAVAALFAAAPGDIVVLPSDLGDAQIVARLTGIETTTVADDAEGTASLRDSLTSALITDIGEQFRAMMRAGHDVAIDETMIEQYF